MWGERGSKPPPGVPISFWSSTLNNVSWSKDGIIAVGGAENVALLVPRLRSAKGDDKEWDNFNIRINMFTDEEVPLMLPLSWKNMSVGEEQSEAFCASLAWSPPGLGKHRRCVLAVLTANHVLSIWDCVGKPDVASDWERVCIVNYALQEHTVLDSFEGTEQEILETRTAKQRIRSFAWSPAPLSSSAPDMSGASAPLSRPYLAVSNDVGDVMIIKVTPPYDLLAPEDREWRTSIVHTFTAAPHAGKFAPIVSCLPSGLQRRNMFVDQLAWSPWSRDATGSLSSVLATTIQSSLQCRIIRLEVTANDTIVGLGPALPRIVDESVAVPTGQMQWMNKLSSDGEMYLIYPCRKTLYCLVFHLRRASGIRVTKQPLDNAWDELSGLAFTKNGQDRPVVQLTFNMNTPKAEVLGWPLPLTDVQPMPPPPWQESLREAEKLFGQDNDLDGHVMTRTYGIDTSPLGDLCAVNSSNHPTDGVEYIIASDQMSSLSISASNDANDREILPVSGGPSHPSEISAEAALLSLQRFVALMPEGPSIESMLEAALVQTFDLSGTPDTQRYQVPITEDTPIRAVMRQVRQNILFQKDAVASRIRLLSTFSGKHVSKKIAPDAKVIRRIVTEVVRMPHFISEASELSQTISHIHDLILAKLDAREGQRDDSNGLSDQDVETCDICSSGIAFESLRWARCPNGHQFARCALSFLAIQTPGTAKFCGICNTQYLNEHLIPDLQASSSDAEPSADDLPLGSDGDQWVMVKQGGAAKEPLISLARILFAAVDRCVCCGGKFVG